MEHYKNKEPGEIARDAQSYRTWFLTAFGDGAEEREAYNLHLRNCVREALSGVTPRQRQMLELYLSGLTVTNIAVELNCNVSTVSRTIRRGFSYIYDHLRFASPRLLNAEMYFTKHRLQQKYKTK